MCGPNGEVLRVLCGPKGELYDVCCSLSIIRAVGWAVHVARMGEKKGADRVLLGNLKEDDHWEGLIVNGR